MPNTFRMFSAERPDECMLAARCLDAVGEYVVCANVASADAIMPDAPSYVGAVRSNITGTEFVVFDAGVATAAAALDARLFPVHVRKQCGVVVYERNLFGAQPREFQIAVPKLCVAASV